MLTGKNRVATWKEIRQGLTGNLKTAWEVALDSETEQQDKPQCSCHWFWKSHQSMEK